MDEVAKGLALANGLRRNTVAMGRRWAQWPGGTGQVVAVVACIDEIRQRLQPHVHGEGGDAAVAACVSDLRAILEWTTYQSSSLATARAIVVARRTRVFAERFGLLDDPAAKLSILVDSETSLLADVGAKNDFMQTLAERHPHLKLPRPLVAVERLAPKAIKKARKLDLIQQLIESTKRK